MLTTPRQQTEMLNQAIQDGGFLQSEAWRIFQERAGHQTEHIESDGLWANMITHTLPLVGKYGYIPRGPIVQFPTSNVQFPNESEHTNIHPLKKLLERARGIGVGWVRVEPDDTATLDSLREAVGREGIRILKAPHDMQSRELLILDIQPDEESLLRQMKPKTRYNIRLAEKRGVKVRLSQTLPDRERVCDLIAVTAKRDGIVPHPRDYYLTMMATLPEEMWTLVLAEYAGQVIAASLVLFHGQYATYLHGASADEYREVMAPYLIQWQTIREARSRGCLWYDFGGVDTRGDKSSWQGITRFKRGFAPQVEVRVFPGAYDIILKPLKYWLYQVLRKMRF
jgi:lipid II:glycine glycyltransferase (peptidoglycan interpeptide bridge formation enzyme)